jgi:hypothetical protein
MSEEKNNHFLIADSRCFNQKLNPIEISVYCRICMRGHKSVCYESIKNMALGCCTSEASVKRALLKLTSLNMVKIQSGKNRGKTNDIKLVPYENWIKIIQEVGHTELPGRSHRPTPSVTLSYLVGHTELHNSTRINRTTYQDSFNAAATQSTALKEKNRDLPKNKSKIWNDKNEDEKFESLLNMAKDSHAGGVKQNKKIKPYLFEDFPDVILPLIKLYGHDTLKELFDYGKEIKKGFNVRWLEYEIKEMFDKKEDNNFQHVV